MREAQAHAEFFSVGLHFQFQVSTEEWKPKENIVLSLMSRFLATKSKPFSSLLSPRHLTSPLKPPWTPSCQRFSTSAAGAAAAADRDRSSRKTLMYLVGVAAAMVGASYAAVPLYRRFCQATGYGGTVQRKEVYLSAARNWFHRGLLVYHLKRDPRKYDCMHATTLGVQLITHLSTSICITKLELEDQTWYLIVS